MTGPEGNSEFCFPGISMFPLTSSWETLRFSGNKIHCSPRDQSLSVKYCTLVSPHSSLVCLNISNSTLVSLNTSLISLSSTLVRLNSALVCLNSA